MDPDQVTVFGGTGFLGLMIVYQLLDAGHAVRIASRRPALPADLQRHDRVEHCSADIRNDDDVARAVAGSRGAVNAVSLYVEQRDLRFTTIHVEGAARLARAASEAGVEHLVHISGIGADAGSRSAYIRARGEGEAAVTTEFRDALMVRPSVLFGPGDAFLRNLATLARLPMVPLFGRGDTRLQPVHVADVAQAVATLFKEPPAGHRVFELGGPDILTYRQIVNQVLEHLGQPRVFVPVPFFLWHLAAGLTSWLPRAPLTRDQVYLMQQDTVTSGTCATFADLGITPRSLEASLPECLPTNQTN